MSGASVEFKDVEKYFIRSDGLKQIILDKVNIFIPAGKTTVIAGGSGQGKSVSLKLVLGLMQADSGSIFVSGEEITHIKGRKLKKLRTRFGVLFQGSALFDSMTVYQNVALPLRERTKKTEKEIRQLVLESLESFELLGHENKFPAQLSGGMKKRVGLSRALQLKPEIMLFDEPTTGLDPVMTQEIYQLFAKTQEEVGFTSIIVSHDIPKVFNLADQVIVLQNGDMDTFPTPEAIQWSEKTHIKKFVEATVGEIYQSHLVEK